MTRSRIERIDAWQAFDSRGTPTVACEVVLSDGRASAIAPSGASRGTHEVVELRDGLQPYAGRGVSRAVAAVRDVIAPELVGTDAADLEGLDDRLVALDGTANLSRLGGNAVLAVSCAAALAVAASQRVPLWELVSDQREVMLPLPMVNIVSGGAHAGRAIDIQDVLVVPVGARSHGEALQWAWDVRRATAELASKDGHPVGLVADEGGLAVPLDSNRAALELVVAGIEHAGFEPGDDVALAVDVAANQLGDEHGYHLRELGPEPVSASELVKQLDAWVDELPLVSIEDPVADTDEEGWRAASALLASRCQLLGDDLFATRLDRFHAAAAEDIGNAVLVKPNQTGTLTGARRVLEAARSAGYATVVSARSGDTEDAWLADLAVGWAAGQIKVGSLTRSERTAKWNRLLYIEAVSGARAVFAGSRALPSGARLGRHG